MLENEIISKMDISFLKGRVMDILPITIDLNTGIIYEQDTLFRLENGTTILLSDNDLGCKKEDIGQEKRIQTMTAFRISIEKCGNDNPEIGIFSTPDDPENSPIIRGIIKTIVEPSEEKYKQFRRYANLDIGIGNILLVLFKDHKEDFSMFHEGDCITINGGRIDLLQME